ncbi:MAG: alpha-glucosidase C-terminal domain-containing protein [Muribaculaceae bacterium]|nr:alpha-glucosidase C-terminal domain-containing protein [Muribaculaceae bacterium]
MKKFLSLVCILAMLVACKPPKNQTNANYQLPAVEDVVMYQVNPRVFAPNNSLKVVAQRVDSISQLGANVMWVMPIYPIGKVKSKNSPYSISDYKQVNPEFGTLDDMKALVDSCHAHGMSIILDWVANHTAWDNVWMKDHKDWYTQDSTGAVIYPPGTDWTDVADLNYDNKEMRAAMIDAMKFWITEVGIDGFRCDVADQVPTDFWKDAITQLRAAAGDRKILMLAEGTNPVNFTEGGFDMNYAWGFMHALDSVFCKNGKASYLIDMDKTEYDEIPDGKVKLRFITNHDEATKYSTVQQFGSIDGALAAFVATTFIHGGMLVYGSQEVAYPEKINFFNYVPVDWNSNPETLDVYKKLISIYKDNAAFRNGDLSAYPDDNVLAFERNDKDGKFLVLVNVRNEKETLKEIPAEWQNTDVTDVMQGTDLKLEKSIELEPFKYLILKRK